MRRHSLADATCPVARTLDIVGEWWTLVIVRDAFRGARRFEDFRTVGIADNILASRLKKLVDEEIFEKRPYQEHPVRYEYVLTEKGRDLLMVLGALGTWGRRWTRGRDSTAFTHIACGQPLSLKPYCDECDRVVEVSEIRPPRRIESASTDAERAVPLGA